MLEQSSHRIFYPLTQGTEKDAMGQPLEASEPIVLRVYPEYSLVGLAVWPSGYALAEIIACQPWRFSGKRVLELGSGVGLTAICLARYCSPPPQCIWMTDYLDAVMDNCRHNLQLSTCDVQFFSFSSLVSTLTHSLNLDVGGWGHQMGYMPSAVVSRHRPSC